MATEQDYAQWAEYEDWNKYQESLKAPKPEQPVNGWGDVARTAVGGASRLLPFGLGDEIVAGGAALSEQLPSFLGGTDRPFGEAYNSTVDELRGYQTAFQKESPLGALAVDIGGGAAMPLGKLAQAPTALGRIAKGATLGAALGGATGFGSGEGDIGNRLDTAATGGAIGLAGGAALGAAAEGVRYGGKLLGKLSDKAAPLTPEEQAIAELGVGKAAVNKAEKFSPAGPMDDPTIEQNLASAKERGVFSSNPAENTPNLILARNKQIVDEANAEAGAILDAASKMQREPVIPAFPSAEKYLTEHALEPALKNKYAQLVNLISDEWDGSVGNLYKAKQMLADVGFSPNSTSTERTLHRIMQHDLNKQVQEVASQLVDPSAGPRLAELGAIQQQHIALAPVLQNSKSATSVAGLKEGADFSLTGALKEVGSEELNQPGVRGGMSQAFGMGSNALLNVANASPQIMGAATPVVGDLSALLNPQQPKKLPRDWGAVKNNPQAKAAIAMKAGVDPTMFSQLPEPAQMQVHKQIITSEPFSAEPAPNNYNIINGEWQNPLEKDFAVRDALGKSPTERALIIGQSFQNKAVVNPSSEALKPPTAQRNPMEISDINSLLGDSPMQYPRAPQTTPSPEMGSMLQRLEEMTKIHAQDELQ